MTLLERLKELATSGERMEGESLTEWHDRYHAENEEVREALLDLLEVAEAAREYRKAEQGLVALGEEITKGITRPPLEFHTDCRKAHALIEQTRERLDAALAKLEAPHEH